MQNITLVIMAAGLGARYGGLKQIEPVGLFDELIIDYSIYDALVAGFSKVVFVIREEIHQGEVPEPQGEVPRKEEGRVRSDVRHSIDGL